MPSIVTILDGGDYETGIAKAAEALRGGGVVALPTETVYGIAGILTDPQAREKLYALRPPGGKPLTLHLAHRDDALQYIDPPSELAARMMRKLWPGPVALRFDVSPPRRAEAAKRLNLDESDLYSEGTITLRQPDNIVAEDVIARAGAPVGLTAASGGGEPAFRIDQIPDSVKEKLDLLVDAGTARFARPSTIVHVQGDRWTLVRSGVYDERIVEKLLRTTILFVCSGNTCRSPMAEVLARKIIAEKLGVDDEELEKKGISVVSAGAMAMAGARATPQAVEAVRDMGIDLSKHRSRPLSVELINQADLIFTMGQSHARAVQMMVPSSAEKVHTLNPEGDIEDPIGSDVSVYQKLAGQLQGLIEQRLNEKGVIGS
jgi:tRNA threonylcarbamoyl adenosine modification protein (Sua5/YciO/YrdC/YwlC family)